MFKRFREVLEPTQRPVQCLPLLFARGIKLTTVHLLPRLRISGVVPPFSFCMYVVVVKVFKHRHDCTSGLWISLEWQRNKLTARSGCVIQLRPKPVHIPVSQPPLSSCHPLITKNTKQDTAHYILPKFQSFRMLMPRVSPCSGQKDLP